MNPTVERIIQIAQENLIAVGEYPIGRPVSLTVSGYFDYMDRYQEKHYVVGIVSGYGTNCFGEYTIKFEIPGYKGIVSNDPRSYVELHPSQI